MNRESRRLVVLMTSFNRRELTLSCLASFETAIRMTGIEPEGILVDDGSTDGTAADVRNRYSWVDVIDGDGALFWNRGMRQAQERAMERDVDYLLWLNDDTQLLPDAIAKLLDTEARIRKSHDCPVIVVGSTSDRNSGELTYGGYVAPSKLKPFTYHRVWQADEPVECHVMNGNVVLIPADVAKVVGNLDAVFEHAMGDTDYALRARLSGFQLFVAPGFVGHCQKNSAGSTYKDPTLPLSVRWNQMMSRKGLPPRSWFCITRRHGGVCWPVYFAWPYVKLIATSLRLGR